MKVRGYLFQVVQICALGSEALNIPTAAKHGGPVISTALMRASPSHVSKASISSLANSVLIPFAVSGRFKENGDIALYIKKDRFIFHN